MRACSKALTFRIGRIGRPWHISSLSLSSLSSVTDNEESTQEVANLIENYASRHQTPISLLDLMSINETPSVALGRLGQRLSHQRTLMNMAELLLEEIPVRLAHRIHDLEQIPMLRDMPSVKQVKSIYVSSFEELLRVQKPESPQLEQDFAKLLNELYLKHSNVLVKMAQGALEYKNSVSNPNDHQLNEDFLNRFYMSRVGIRVLAGQYLALRHQLLDENATIPSTYVGMICKETSPYDVVQSAIQDATMLCEREFGEAPSVEVIGRLDLTFCYIPTHLHYILLELLKNAMRATMEFHSDKVDKPSITVVIANGKENEDVIIKVSDEGGGIPRSQIQRIWSYCTLPKFTTLFRFCSIHRLMASILSI